MIHMLTANRDLSPQDRDALAIRLLHFDVGGEAELWLRQRGGMKFTGSGGRRWIAGDAGQKSDYVVAKHFLHLWAHRAENPPGGRLLVEGGNCPELMFEMRTGSGAGPLVIESLVQLTEKNPLPAGVVWEKGKLYVLSREVLKYYRENLSQSSRRELTAQNIRSVFNGLMIDKPRLRILESKRAEGMKMWYCLDIDAILTVARRMGWVCKNLENWAMGGELEKAKAMA